MRTTLVTLALFATTVAAQTGSTLAIATQRAHYRSSAEAHGRQAREYELAADSLDPGPLRTARNAARTELASMEREYAETEAETSDPTPRDTTTEICDEEPLARLNRLEIGLAKAKIRLRNAEATLAAVEAIPPETADQLKAVARAHRQQQADDNEIAHSLDEVMSNYDKQRALKRAEQLLRRARTEGKLPPATIQNGENQ